MALLNTKQDKEQFLKWIAALRSGKYPQTQNRLQDKKGYCCLGVACKVLIPENELEVDCFGEMLGTMPNDQTYAPEWLKSIIDNFYSNANLILLNDKLFYTFEQIAEKLELFYEEQLNQID
jgi:hypothetical protein